MVAIRMWTQMKQRKPQKWLKNDNKFDIEKYLLCIKDIDGDEVG